MVTFNPDLNRESTTILINATRSRDPFYRTIVRDAHLSGRYRRHGTAVPMRSLGTFQKKPGGGESMGAVPAWSVRRTWRESFFGATKHFGKTADTHLALPACSHGDVSILSRHFSR
jgi:hypothetical protein